MQKIIGEKIMSASSSFWPLQQPESSILLGHHQYYGLKYQWGKWKNFNISEK